MHTAITTGCGLLDGALAEEEVRSEPLDAVATAQPQHSSLAVVLLSAEAAVALIACAFVFYRCGQGACALWIILADYLRFVLTAVRTGKSSPSRTVTSLRDG